MASDLRDAAASTGGSIPADDAARELVLTNPVPEPEAPASVGAFLAAARERAGLSLGDVATRLRMSVRQIEALERADYAALPGGTFLRGLVRNYAKAVYVSADEALAVLEATHADGAPVRATKVLEPVAAVTPTALARGTVVNTSSQQRALAVLGVLVVLAAVVFYWWEFVRPHRGDGGWPKTTPATTTLPVAQPTVTTPATPPANDAAALTPSAPSTDASASPVPSSDQTLAAARAAAAGVTASPATPTSPASSALPTSSATPKASMTVSPVAAAPTAQASKAAPAPAKPTATPVAAAPAPQPPTTTPTAPTAVTPASAAAEKARRVGESGVLGFTFSGESWVEVIDGSGRAILSRRFRAGDADEVSGRAPFTIVIGDATNTRMAFNGREFDLAPHTRSSVARVTIK
ncbi:MAG: RodZ domain-containing protein [Burkholderiales bacterium]